MMIDFGQSEGYCPRETELATPETIGGHCHRLAAFLCLVGFVPGALNRKEGAVTYGPLQLPALPWPLQGNLQNP